MGDGWEVWQTGNGDGRWHLLRAHFSMPLVVPPSVSEFLAVAFSLDCKREDVLGLLSSIQERSDTTMNG